MTCPFSAAAAPRVVMINKMYDKRDEGKGKEQVKSSLHRLGYSQLRIVIPVLVHANELQQLSDDFLRARHVPLGEGTLRRVPDRSREDILRRELQLCTLVLTGPILPDQ